MSDYIATTREHYQELIRDAERFRKLERAHDNSRDAQWCVRSQGFYIDGYRCLAEIADALPDGTVAMWQCPPDLVPFRTDPLISTP